MQFSHYCCTCEITTYMYMYSRLHLLAAALPPGIQIISSCLVTIYHGTTAPCVSNDITHYSLKESVQIQQLDYQLFPEAACKYCQTYLYSRHTIQWTCSLCVSFTHWMILHLANIVTGYTYTVAKTTAGLVIQCSKQTDPARKKCRQDVCKHLCRHAASYPILLTKLNTIS